MRYLALLLIASCATNNPLPTPQDKQWQTGEMVTERQPNQTWCAISAARSVMSQKFEARLPSQCEIAGKIHGEDCCARKSLKCESRVRSEQVFDVYGLPYMVDHYPTFDSVVKEIKNGKPVVLYHYLGSDNTHAVVVYWAFERDGKTYVVVYDPLTDTQKVWDKSYEVGNLKWDQVIVLR